MAWLVTASLATACGDDDQPAAEQQPAPIPRAYTAEIDAICKRTRRDIRDLGRRPPRAADKEGFVRYTSDADASLVDAIRVMRAVRLPRGDAGPRAKEAIDETERRVIAFSDGATEQMLTAVVEGSGEREAIRRYSDALDPDLHAPLREVIGARSCRFEAPLDRGAPKKPVERPLFE